MSEQRTQGKYVPLRVRFRAPTEQERSEATTRALTPTVPDLRNASEKQRRSQQIKELLRLTNLLRADISLDEVLQQFAASICACTGFRMLVINLIDEQSNFTVPVAFAGISEDGIHYVQDNALTIEHMQALMNPEFRISESYFVPHGHELNTTTPGFISKTLSNHEAGGWHSEDLLIVPLICPREKKLLGCLSLDDPEDGKIPTLEGIEIVELFANHAAIAIDNARLFQERESRRVDLETGIAQLKEDLERIQGGDLRVRVRSSHQSLQPIADAVNAMVEEISGILGSMQKVTQAVDEHTRSVQMNSRFLVRDTTQQERQVNQISDVISQVAEMIRQISVRSTDLSKMAAEAMDVTLMGQGTVDRAVEGMTKVRETTMEAGRKTKRLGESGQEINETIIAITDLTTRMHLLALNAAIEAARAGEHGQGFAVIAQEIRTLAMSSADAARKVGGYIRSIQLETTTVSQSIDENTRQVVNQTELVTQMGVSLEAISTVTDQIATLVHGICSMAENQTHGSDRIVSAVSEILRMTGEITQHMREMQQSLGHLVELANSLRERMTIFRMS